ncbi:MAG: PEP-CTERM sorting domain-containing protein [Planctomycetota bacterium]|nr:PEP-CTERM sorting domain-containing protein [Planctomycetota bacterium]
MFRIGRFLSGAFLLMAMSVPAVANTFQDNFGDNAMGPQWTLVQDDPPRLWLEETLGRLELRAAAPVSSSTDALYLSNGAGGLQLKVSSDFTVSIDYNFSAFSGTGGIALDLGIGRDLAGTDAAAVAYLRYNVPTDPLSPLKDRALGAAYRVGGAQQEVPIALSFPDSGTLTLHYDSAADQLTLGAGASTTILANLVKGQWNADTVWVSFGGRGDGLTLAGGNAYLDNLSVTGDIIAVPEPATLALVALGGLAVLRRRR